MSGIIGYMGRKKALPILIDCLMHLDYRGYDSAGVAVSDGTRTEVRKCRGRIHDLETLLLHEPIDGGHMGIGHTRWASHGTPTDENAHPVSDDEGRFFVVHNGIIENDAEIRKELIGKGQVFQTETDTEIVPRLLLEYDTGDLEETVRRIRPRLEGAFALAIMSQSEPDKIIAMSQGNPLVIGWGKEEAFLSSDIPALLSYTREIHPIKNDEMALITSDGVRLKTLNGDVTEPKTTRVQWNTESVMLQGYDHYMLKEIFEQPSAVEKTLQDRLTEDGVIFPELQKLVDNQTMNHVNRALLVGSGTSYHAGMIGKKALEKMVDIPVEVEIASEFAYDHSVLDERTLVIVLSQSGETADTLSAMEEALAHGSPVLAITNKEGSNIARKADYTIYTQAGPELAVAATKAYTCQIATLSLLAVWLKQHRFEEKKEKAEHELIQALHRLPQDLEATLVMVEDAIDQFAQVTNDQDHLFLVGRGLDYTLSLEGALKLQEVAYLHADAYPAGEMKHGTMALLTPGIPVIALATQPHLNKKMVSNIKEIKARGAFVVGLTTVGNDTIREVADEALYISSTHPMLMPLLTAVPLQLLAYYSGTVRGHDVDRPRNVAKSLTVE